MTAALKSTPDVAPHKPTDRCVDTCDNPFVCRDEWEAWQAARTPNVTEAVEVLRYLLKYTESHYEVTCSLINEHVRDALEKLGVKP